MEKMMFQKLFTNEFRKLLGIIWIDFKKFLDEKHEKNGEKVFEKCQIKIEKNIRF